MNDGWVLLQNNARENEMENVKGADIREKREENYVVKKLNENSIARSGTVLNLILLTGILDTNRLSGPNYVDWLQKLKIILDAEQIGYVIDTTITDPLPEEPDLLNRRRDDELKARSYILASMTNELQCRYEKIDNVATIMLRLQESYGERSRTAKYNMSKELFQMRMTEGTDVTEHVLKMMNLIRRLESLNFVMDNALQTDLILHSLPDSFSMFKLNFYMNKMECALEELLNMLLSYQRQLKDMGEETLLAATSLPYGTKSDKKKKKKKKEARGAAETDKCFHCEKEGHWKRNCSDYLASLKVKKDISFKGSH